MMWRFITDRRSSHHANFAVLPVALAILCTIRCASAQSNAPAPSAPSNETYRATPDIPVCSPDASGGAPTTLGPIEICVTGQARGARVAPAGSGAPFDRERAQDDLVTLRPPPRQPNGRLMTAGGILFGLSYLPALIGGIAGAPSGLWFVIPVVGAAGNGFAIMADTACYPGLCTAAGLVLLFDAVVQGVGVGLLIGGIVARSNVAPRNSQARSAAPRRLQWALTPGTTATPVGLSFTAIDF